MAEDRITWLHLSDLHCGQPGQAPRWEAAWPALELDLRRMAALWGPPDLLLFTGDLAFAGQAVQYGSVDRILAQIRATVGRDPLLVPVPGNHDLTRPAAGTGAALLAAEYHQDPEVRRAFLQGRAGTVGPFGELFADYRAWFEEQVRPTWDAADGVSWQASGRLPGDFRLSFTRGGLRLGLVGLNSAFLDLADERRWPLALEAEQLSPQLGDWLAEQDAALLLHHHPFGLLGELHQEVYERDIYPDQPTPRFLAALCGHLHRSRGAQVSHGSGVRRYLQATSLFGMEDWGRPGERRIHGYGWGRLVRTGPASGVLERWPRQGSLGEGGALLVEPAPGFTVGPEQLGVALRDRPPAGTGDRAQGTPGPSVAATVRQVARGAPVPLSPGEAGPGEDGPRRAAGDTAPPRTATAEEPQVPAACALPPPPSPPATDDSRRWRARWTLGFGLALLVLAAIIYLFMSRERCGDGVIQAARGEECDPGGPLTANCESLGFDEGSLSCSAECRHDPSHCVTHWPFGDGPYGDPDDPAFSTAGHCQQQVPHDPDLRVPAGRVACLNAGQTYDFRSITVAKGGRILITGASPEWTIIGSSGPVNLDGKIIGRGVFHAGSHPYVLKIPDQQGAPGRQEIRHEFPVRAGGDGGRGGNAQRTGGSGGASHAGHGGGGGGGGQGGGGGARAALAGSNATDAAGGTGGTGASVTGSDPKRIEQLSDLGAPGGQPRPPFDTAWEDQAAGAGANGRGSYDDGLCGEGARGADGGGGGAAGSDGRLLFLISKGRLSGHGEIDVRGQAGGRGGAGGHSRGSSCTESDCAGGGGGGGAGAGGFGGQVIIWYREGNPRPTWPILDQDGAAGSPGAKGRCKDVRNGTVIGESWDGVDGGSVSSRKEKEPSRIQPFSYHGSAGELRVLSR